MLLVVSSIHKRRAGLNESERAGSWETLGHVIWRAINLHAINKETWRWDFNDSRCVHKWLQVRHTYFASASFYHLTSATTCFFRVLHQDDFSQMLKKVPPSPKFYVTRTFIAVLGAFAQLWKGTVSFIMSVCLYLTFRLHKKNSATSGWIFIKFDI